MASEPHCEPDEPDKLAQDFDLIRVECPVCGALLFRARIEGEALIEIKCDRCNVVRFLYFPVVELPGYSEAPA